MAPGFLMKEYEAEELKSLTHWIRDELDPIVAREGPLALTPDDVLKLHDMFTSFAHDPHDAGISLATLRFSRMHQAVLDVASKATRWPGRLIDLCDDVIEVWEDLWGPLKDIPLLLYDEGGRLWHVVQPGYFSNEVFPAL